MNTSRELLAERRRELRNALADERIEFSQVMGRAERPLARVAEIQKKLAASMRRLSFLALPLIVMVILHPKTSLRAATIALGLWRTWLQSRHWVIPAVTHAAGVYRAPSGTQAGRRA